MWLEDLMATSADLGKAAGPRDAPSHDFLLAIVEQAWRKVLPGPIDPTLTWEESGGDSLATLQLLLQLEKRLGRRLAFDLLTSDMSPIDIARALASDPPPSLAPPGPVVFLLPGLYGDEPILADFRRSFAGRIRFEVLEHPTLHMPMAVLADPRETGAQAAAEIIVRQPYGDIYLAGYSYGGTIAFEAADHLVALGRQVAWLGILDAGFGKRAVEQSQEGLWLRAVDALIRACRDDAVRAVVLTILRRLRPDKGVWFRRRLLAHFRTQINAEWRPRGLQDVSVLVAMSNERSAAIERRWLDLCPDARILRLPTEHLALFQPTSLALLTPVFEQSLRAAFRRPEETHAQTEVFHTASVTCN